MDTAVASRLAVMSYAQAALLLAILLLAVALARGLGVPT
jgi:uncharacterized membrane protein